MARDARARASTRARRPSAKVLADAAVRSSDDRRRERVPARRNGRTVSSLRAEATSRAAARTESEQRRRAAAVVADAAERARAAATERAIETAAACSEDCVRDVVPSSIFEDPLLEEISMGASWGAIFASVADETRATRLDLNPMSPSKKRSIDAADDFFDDVCESSPRAPPLGARRRRLSASGRRTTLRELISSRETLRMGVSERAARMSQLWPNDLDSARESPQIEARKAISRSQSLNSVELGQFVGSSQRETFRKASPRSGADIPKQKRDNFYRQIHGGMLAARMFPART